MTIQGQGPLAILLALPSSPPGEISSPFARKGSEESFGSGTFLRKEKEDTGLPTHGSGTILGTGLPTGKSVSAP